MPSKPARPPGPVTSSVPIQYASTIRPSRWPSASIRPGMRWCARTCGDRSPTSATRAGAGAAEESMPAFLSRSLLQRQRLFLHCLLAILMHDGSAPPAHVHGRGRPRLVLARGQPPRLHPVGGLAADRRAGSRSGHSAAAPAAGDRHRGRGPPAGARRADSPAAGCGPGRGHPDGGTATGPAGVRAGPAGDDRVRRVGAGGHPPVASPAGGDTAGHRPGRRPARGRGRQRRSGPGRWRRRPR